jgi:hypothetical protein
MKHRMRLVGLTIFLVASLLTAMGQADDKEKKNRIPDDRWTILEKAEQIVLLSVDPEKPETVPPNDFHGWKVLGKTSITDPEVRRDLMDAFKKGVDDYKPGPIPACFNPRHGIQASYNGKTVDFIICFQCEQLGSLVNGKDSYGLRTTRSAQPIFNKILTEAKVPLPQK